MGANIYNVGMFIDCFQRNIALTLSSINTYASTISWKTDFNLLFCGEDKLVTNQAR